MRRLPIYFLIDTSVEMLGHHMETLKNVLQVMLSSFRQNPQLVESGVLSINNLSESNNKINPLIEVSKYELNDLQSSQYCFLGKSLSLLIEDIDKNVVKTTQEVKGDWKPLVFVLLASEPKDEYLNIVNELKKVRQRTIVILIGNKVSIETANAISDNVVHMDNVDSLQISKYFAWSSGVVVSSELSTIKEDVQIINLKKEINKNEKITNIFFD
ncbi:MAG: hypothetical protein ACJAX3_002402 [Patiriisocius sp.]|jgi:uncharacterized protein YegL